MKKSIDLKALKLVRLEKEREKGKKDGENNEKECLVVGREQMVYKVKVCDRTEQAMIDEIEKLKEFDSYEVVEDRGQTSISTRWVITEKEDGRKKACLVARGFEEKSEIQSDSPTLSKSLVRFFLTMCSTQ